MNNISKIVMVLISLMMAAPYRLFADETPRNSAGTMDQEKIMKAMEEAGKITEQHKSLDYLAGDWSVKSKSWPGPNTKPEESVATATFRQMYDGRFLQENYHGTFMGKPFEGIAYLGYDNMKKKYTTVWMDNLSTGVYLFDGDSYDKGKTITSSSTFMCPITQAPKTVRSVMKKVSNNEVRYEHYDKDPTGKEFKSMELVYKR